MPLHDSPGGNVQGPPEEARHPFEPLFETPTSRRFLLAKGGIVLTFGALAVRLWQMQIAEGRQYARLAEQNRVDARPIPPPRGVIYDRHGVIVAGNKANWNVTIIPALLPTDETARRETIAEVGRILKSPWVVVVQPNRLLAGSEADIYARLSAALDRPAAALVEAVRRAVEADQLPVAHDSVSPSDVPRVRAEVAGLPGIELLSRPEFQLRTSGLDPRVPVVIQSDVPRDVALLIESRSVLLPGVGIEPTPGRAYPLGAAAAHVVGYVGPVDPKTRVEAKDDAGQPLYDLTDFIGQSGMEQVLEPVLRGTKGFHIVEVDINHRIVRELENRPAVPGASVVLTIDRKLQEAAAEALTTQMERAGSLAGAAVAIDPTSGEVLALVSMPTFDSQAFADGMPAADYEHLVADPNRPLFNRCTAGLYAPGACQMPFVALAALREKVIVPGSIHVCRGGAYIPAEFNEITRRLFRCWQPTGHGSIAVETALAKSCDVFFYNLAVPALPDARGKNYRYYDQAVGGEPIEFHGLGIEKMNAMSAAFGFGRVTGIELDNELPGLLPSPEWRGQQPERGVWTIGDTINTSIGQGDLLVTPLQMAVATAAIANGGTLYRPRLLKRILPLDGPAVPEPRSEVAGRIAIDATAYREVRDGLWRSTTEGTAAGRVNVPGIKVAGKTGTAETETADERGVSRQKPHAWFTAFAPLEAPRIALAVVLEKGGWGADHAAPVAEKMLRAFFRV